MKAATAKPAAPAPKQGTLKWAAAKLGVTLPSVYKLIKEKKLRSFKVGAAHRISEQALADCIRKLELEHEFL